MCLLHCDFGVSCWIKGVAPHTQLNAFQRGGQDSMGKNFVAVTWNKIAGLLVSVAHNSMLSCNADSTCTASRYFTNYPQDSSGMSHISKVHPHCNSITNNHRTCVQLGFLHDHSLLYLSFFFEKNRSPSMAASGRPGSAQNARMFVCAFVV